MEAMHEPPSTPPVATGTAPATPRLAARFFIVFGVSIAVLLGVVLPVTLLAPSRTDLIVGVLAVGHVILVTNLAFRMIWKPMVAAYPPREPAPDAVRRRFQSTSLGIVNLGLSTHIAADATYLHLTPLGIFRPFGAVPTSIPWTALEPVGRPGHPPTGARLRPGGYRLAAPRWVMELLGPAT